jgi:hypothetical protein
MKSAARRFLLVLLLLIPISVACQGIDDDFLNSAVFIKRMNTENREETGSGFLLARIVSADLKTFQVILITNKHVLPKEGDQNGAITLKIAIRNGEAIETKEISVAILGPDKKYTNHVAMHPDSKVDVYCPRRVGIRPRHQDNGSKYAPGIDSSIRFTAISANSGFISMPTHLRESARLTSPTVPVPKNGSSTTDPFGAPARMQSSTSFGGNTAKCAPLNPLVLIFQTERRFFGPSPRIDSSWIGSGS